MTQTYETDVPGTAAGPSARPLSRREEARQDARLRAELELQREAARAEQRRADDRAWAEDRRQARVDRDARRARARAGRARANEARMAWLRDHLVDLLFVPVIGIPGALAWSAMATYGQSVWGLPGVIMPAFSEGAMWAFDAAVTIRRRRNERLGEDRPVWHLQLGIVIFAAYGAALNFLHGMSPATPHHGLAVAISMALVSVAGVTAHQLVTAGPRRSRAERDARRLGRAAGRRELAARRASVRGALAVLGEDGSASLIYQPGTARLARRWGRTRLVPVPAPLRDPGPPDDDLAGLDDELADLTGEPPVRDSSVQDGPVPAAAPAVVRAEPVQPPDPAGSPDGSEAGPKPPLAGASRSDVVAMVAEQIREAVDAGTTWRPDYPALMALTGNKRSWCEKVFRAARELVLTGEDDTTAAARTGEDADRTDELTLADAS